MHIIDYPEIETFFIATNNDQSMCHYGAIASNQCLSTGLVNIQTYDNQAEWIEQLKTFDIVINPETNEVDYVTEEENEVK